MKLLVFTCAVTALLLCSAPVQAAEMKEDVMVEQTTESPIADMALVDTMKADTVMAASEKNSEKEAVQKLPAETQPQTIADFIIHPLIALKPRLPETESGKQASTATTTPSPWQLFGFNAGQGLGSSVSNLAGSVTGWLGNRIQLPGLLETPVTETTTTSTSTTTTPKPDVVVRVKQRASTRKPLISINNDDDRPFRRKRPNRFNGNNVDYSEEEDDSEEDDDEDFNRNRKRYHNDDEDDEDDDSSHENDQEDDEDEDDEEDNGNNQDDEDEEEEDERPVKQQNKNRRRRPKPLNHNSNKRRNSNNNQRRRNSNAQRKRQQQKQQEESAEVEQYEDDDEDGNNDQDFYYNKNQGSKRSQSEQNFIQRGQQSLLNQIRQFTRGQTPAEVSNTLRKSPTKKRRQQATLIINRNGQTIYVAPELLQATDASSNKVSATKTKRPTSQYPQPPLTVPYRRKGQPTQYITIPWSQLGISPPDQIVSLTEGIQSQPLILNIPQSAIDNMQSVNPNKKQSITAEAVPLLAEASIMDIFKPPRIPPARTPTTKKVALSNTPVVIATKPKGGPTRIRPATLVEKAPADDSMDDKKTSSESMDNEPETAQFIVIGDESGETELSRSAYRQILDYFNHHRVGRQLNGEEVAAMEEMAGMEAPKSVEDMAAMETPMEVPKAMDKEVAPMDAPKVVEDMTVMETPMEAPKAIEEVASKIEEQFIPVQVISAEEEPAKVEATVEEKLETVTESSVMDAPKEVTEKVEAAVEDKMETVKESVEEAKVEMAETMME
ncbi:probable serine/threonine-protein kinase kinX [Lucilia cuprina]|uniref:probable serine/threonine-protein kinase kinX n=1 Tax=Lucilia cuprina TaxID=7375 RepID=UPI001F061635|nr:probable serine/threonine-protein kinase kinX [Lucilia cuprina]